MKRAIKLAALLAAGVSGAGAAHAQVAIGGSIGTTGVAVEAQIQALPGLQLRGGYNYLQYGADDTYDGVDYTGDLDLNAIGAFVDFHPFGNGFLITGGAYFGEKTLDLLATPATNVQIDTTSKNDQNNKKVRNPIENQTTSVIFILTNVSITILILTNHTFCIVE